MNEKLYRNQQFLWQKIVVITVTVSGSSPKKNNYPYFFDDGVGIYLYKEIMDDGE